MNLTHEYRTVRALFEGSENEYVEESDLEYYPYGFTKYFQVGPIEYEILIVNNGQYWSVSFKFNKMVAKSEKELTDYFSEIRGRLVDEYEVNKIYERALKKPYDTLSLGKPSQVFGEMFLILKQFIQKYNPKCFGFVCADKRVDLYDKMFSRMFPSSQWKKEIISHPREKDFEFCRVDK